MESKLYKNYSLAFILTLFLPCLILFIATKMADPYAQALLLEDKEYFARLRGNSTFGCATFIKKNPDLLVVGDSHAYEGFLYADLSEKLGLSKISACTMGGFYIESFPKVIDLLKKHKVFPKTILFASSLRQFTTIDSKHNALATHDVYLSRSNFTVFDFIKKILGFQINDMASLLSDSELNKIIAEHSESVDQVTEESAARYIQKFPNHSVESWSKWIKEVTISDNMVDKIDSICKELSDQHVQLIVVDMPESPHLKEMYPLPLRNKYDQLLDKFKSCSSLVLDSKFSESINFGNRYFFNRFMENSFPYQKINSGQKIDIEKDGYSADYNLDHMNLVGSRVFTGILAEELLKRAPDLIK